MSTGTPDPSDRRRLYGRSDALDGEDFDDVADLDVVVVLEPDAALEASLHLAHVVLEAAERAQAAFVDEDVIPQEPGLCLARALDDARR